VLIKNHRGSAGSDRKYTKQLSGRLGKIGTVEGQVEKLKLPLIEPAAACAEDGDTSTLVTELHISNI